LYDGAATSSPGAADALKDVVLVDQTVEPKDFTDSGVGWKRLGVVRVTGTTLSVKVSAQSDGAVIADAIRIQPLKADTAPDDNFYLPATSPAADRGSLS